MPDLKKTLSPYSYADGLPRSSPGAHGVSADGLAGFIDYLERREMELHSLMLYRGDAVIAEGWWWPYNPDKLHMQHSATKSFVATAVGIAVAEGQLDLDDTVVSFFTDELPSKVSSNLADMTVKHLLTMTVGQGRAISGAIWRPITTSWVAEFLKEPVPNKPGSTFLYSSAASYMLSAIMQKVTGERLIDYMRTRIFDPLRISDVAWDVCPNGVNPGGNGMSARTADMLKLGILHLRQGRWIDGRRVMAEEWVSAATTNQIANTKRLKALTSPIDGYGYHWWTRADGSYYAWGIFGQFSIVFPQYDAVLAITGALPGFSQQPFLQVVDEKLVPLLAGSTPREQIDAESRLCERFTGLRLLSLAQLTSSPLIGEISGRKYVMVHNELGVTSVELTFVDDTCLFSLEDGAGRHFILAGIGKWIEQSTSMPGRQLHHEYAPEKMDVVASGEWSSPRCFTMIWQFSASAFRDTVSISFEDSSLTMHRLVNVNTGATEWPQLEGHQGSKGYA